MMTAEIIQLMLSNKLSQLLIWDMSEQEIFSKEHGHEMSKDEEDGFHLLEKAIETGKGFEKTLQDTRGYRKQ